ncbi:hypothetical protein [Dactylosporangium salmoneum]|uniref:Uncharacterized protein n=1 Tax=Dactylosporangium salmoneum TaxID=53361 RepID=A0ABN3HMZ1_9ACTN
MTSWWIGGSPCSGKSTVAGLLAAARGATLYSCDDAFERHAAGPAFAKVAAMGVAARLAQPVEVQVADVLQLYRDEFPLILRDLAAVPGPVLAEGAALLPELLAAHKVPATHAVWIVPTEPFQRRYYARRPWARALLAATPDPDASFDRWMRRDAAFARLIATQARAAGYRVLTVDGTIPLR